MKYYVNENPLKGAINSLLEHLMNEGIIEKEKYYARTIIESNEKDDITSINIFIKKESKYE